jgi:hypothetical protein
MAMTFTDLQNGFYNLMLEALGFTNTSNVQVIQPGFTFAADQLTDRDVWNWMNDIPIASLSQGVPSGNQFFSDYEAVFSSLTPSISVDFAGDIGAAAFNAWVAFQSTLPNLNFSQLPGLFFNWALTRGFFSVANKGSADLAAMVLDPINRGQLMLQPYQPRIDASGNVIPGKLPEWSIGIAALVSQVLGAAAKSASTDDLRQNTDVSDTWTHTNTSKGFLWWGTKDQKTNETMASQLTLDQLTISVSFQHALTFVAVPGLWYDSAAFGLAYNATNGGPPWNPHGEVTWQEMFGSDHGRMQRFTSALIVVSGINMSATSSHKYDTEQITTIQENKKFGLWPFYQNKTVTTGSDDVKVNDDGTLTITSTSPANVPILIGRILIPVHEYLDSAIAGRAQFLRLAAKSPLAAKLVA